MARFTGNFLKNGIGTRLVFALLVVTTILACQSAGQTDHNPPQVREGSLLYRSPISGRYESVPLVHTDATLDVRGLVAAATVTQQYVNSSTAPIEAVYIFPLPHDAAVYDMEIRIGNRVIRSVIHEREEAKRVYEAAKSEGKRAALVEEERPNIFTASVANIMPNDRIDVRLLYVESLRWEKGRMRLIFPMVVGPRYIPGTEAVDHIGTGWAADTDAVPDASRITPVIRNPENRSGHDIRGCLHHLRLSRGQRASSGEWPAARGTHHGGHNSKQRFHPRSAAGGKHAAEGGSFPLSWKRLRRNTFPAGCFPTDSAAQPAHASGNALHD